MTKSQIENRLILLEKRVDELQVKSPTFYKYYCASCGNPFMLNENQFERRKDKDRAFYCAAGHSNVFNK